MSVMEKSSGEKWVLEKKISSHVKSMAQKSKNISSKYKSFKLLIEAWKKSEPDKDSKTEEKGKRKREGSLTTNILIILTTVF